MGQIITLQDGLYTYELPKMPSDEKEIAGYNLKKNDQLWRIPPRVDLKRCGQSAKMEYINEERRRWLEGYWLFINGEPTWITGMHYDHMVNMKFEFGRALYFDQQRLDFYMRDLVRKDDKCYGTAWYKPRRYGMTAEELTNSIYVGTEDFNQNVGLMSNEGKKCITTLMRPIVDAIIHRPKYMRPKFYSPSGRKPRVSMEFTDGQVDFDEDDMLEEFASLNGMILPYNTTTAAMDGTKKHYIVMDEPWKWTSASPKDTLGINKKCVEDFGISGKISMLSTMGDSDDYKAAIKEGIQIGDESDPRVRDGNGRTTSGLYRYFVGAIHSKTLPKEFTDRFGKVHEERATEFIMNDRAKFDVNSKDYIFEIRRMPLTYDEATSTADSGSVYPNLRLGKRRRVLASLPIDKKPYVVGFLDEDINGEVLFRPDPKGIWKIAIQPFVDKTKGIDTRNRFHKSSGKITPPKNQEFCWGYDPIRYSDKIKDGKKSESSSVSHASILVGQKYDYFGSGIQRLPRLAGLCKFRPDTAGQGHREAQKACKYWGMAGMHERQVESVVEEFEEAKMLAMLMRSEKDNEYGMWTDNHRKVVKNGVEMVQSGMKVDEEDGYDPINDVPFEEVIYDRMHFDPYQTSPFDVEMSEIMLNYGYKQMKFTNVQDTTNSGKQKRAILFPKRQPTEA